MIPEGRIIQVSFTAAGLSLLAVVQDGESVSVRLQRGSIASGIWRRGQLVHFQADGELAACEQAVQSAAEQAIQRALKKEVAQRPASRPRAPRTHMAIRLQEAAQRPDQVGATLSTGMRHLLAQMPIPLKAALSPGELMSLLGLVRRGRVVLREGAWQEAEPGEMDHG
jgi:hypothetical protein